MNPPPNAEFDRGEPEVEGGWYADRFGFHQHPDEWPLNITKRAHERCRRAWLEARDHQTILQDRAEEGE